MFLGQLPPQLVNLHIRLLLLSRNCALKRQVRTAIDEMEGVVRVHLGSNVAPVSSRQLLRDVRVLQWRRRLGFEPRTVGLQSVRNTVVLILCSRDGGRCRGPKALLRGVGGHQHLRLRHLLAKVKLALVHHQAGFGQAARSCLLKSILQRNLRLC